MIWLLCSVVLCLGATVIIMEDVREQDAALDSLYPIINIQQHSVVHPKDKLDHGQFNNGILFSGLEILYGLRGWYEQRIEIVLDENVLLPLYDVSSNHTVESILKNAIGLLEMDSMYNVRLVVNSNGTILRILFVNI